MPGSTNFPTALDDDTSLYDVTDSVSTLQAAHHNNPKEAIKALEAKVGIYGSGVPTSLDYRIGNATNSHSHNGASGQGQRINPTAILFSDGESLAQARRFTQSLHFHGSMSVGSNVAAPISIGRTAQIENIAAVLRRGPSGATAAINLRIGPTNVWGASVGLGLNFAPGATRYGQASPNVTTYPSGAIITMDVTAVGSSDPGQDLSVVFLFRE